MEKTFVPLPDSSRSSRSSSKTSISSFQISNPHRIKTWQGPTYKTVRNPENLRLETCCDYKRKCEKSPKRKTLHDEVNHVYKAILDAKKPSKRKVVKRKCIFKDKYTECVHEKKTPMQLRENAIKREKAAIIIKQLKEVRHKHPRVCVEPGGLKELPSPTSTGGELVKPKKASPSCSTDEIFIPSRRMLDLKPPRSGIFLNEQKLPKDSSLPFKNYNPRTLQPAIDEVTPHRIIEKNRRFYIRLNEDEECEKDENWWDNWSEKEKTCTDPCCCLFFKNTFEDANAFEECLHNYPKIFKIPDDLHEDFVPDCLLGSTRCKREKEDVKKAIDKRRPKSVAALYAAFFKSLTTPLHEWGKDSIDEIIEAGTELQERSVEWFYEDKDSDFDIIPEDRDNKITIELKHKFQGALNCYSPNILKALTLFFKNSQTCILQCRTLYLIIWRVCDHFCAFDPNARTEDLTRDWYTGKACLMKIKQLEHLVHVILNLSELEANDVYNLYDIRLINFGTIPNPIEIMEFNKKKKLYVIVNRYYALIPGTKGMEPPEDPEDTNASFIVALIARLYEKIDPPQHWTRKTIDNLIKFGERLYTKLKLKSINVRDLPSQVYIGNFRVNFEIVPFLYRGFVSECSNYQYSPLTSSLMQLLEQYNSALIAIDNSVIAFWCDNNFYYIFDPFERGPNGKVINTEENSGNAILQMHLTKESLCRMLYINALQMKNTGNFLIHALTVKSIFFFNQNQSLAEKGTNLLKVNFPGDCDTDLNLKKDISCSNISDLLTGKTVPSNVADECLSVLSVSPCQRTCSETDVYEKEKKDRAKLKRDERLKHGDSLESLLELEKIPDDDSGDVAIKVLDHIICLLMVQIAAESREPEKLPPKAKKVLIKSDRDYLETIKLKIKRGLDYDNICESFRTKPLQEYMISLRDELAIPSNFCPLPDGGGIIKGNYCPESYDSTTAIIAAIVAYLVSRKFNISTWDSDIVDYVMKTASDNSLFLPIFYGQEIKMKISKKTYSLSLKKVDSGSASDLGETLERNLTQYKFIIIIFKRFVCGVIRRYNFFYLYITNSDIMGFFSLNASSTPCLLRFYDFSLLVSRIDFNRSLKYGRPEEVFTILRLVAKDISPEAKQKFYPLSPSDEELLYQRVLEEKTKFDKRTREKLAFLDEELQKEKQRIEDFMKEKEEAATKQDKKLQGKLDEYEDEEGEEEMEEIFVESEEEEVEEEESVEKKHKPGESGVTKITEEPIYSAETLGYRYIDNYFQIPGNMETSKDASNSDESVGLCYFAGIYAILFAIMHPLSRWDSERVDQVISNSQELFEAVNDKSFACTRKINSLKVDNHRFNVNVQVFENDQLRILKADISQAIKNIIKTKQYFLMHVSTTFAIYKDKYWHVFDPYWTNEDSSKNHASWILFPNLDIMLEYIGQKEESHEWKTQYKLHVVDIRSFKKLPRRKVKIIEDITTLTSTQKSKKLWEDIKCLEEERIEWVHCCPFWSRKLDKNMVGNPRGISISVWKGFDIELPNKVFSLWGTLHPLASIFKKSSGKQYLATNVIACCMANLYPITEWNSLLIDAIVVYGDQYFNESIKGINSKEYEFSLEDLNTTYATLCVQWNIHLESIIFGKLYNKKKGEFNLSSALGYFFSDKNEFGIIQCQNKSLAFGLANTGYFLFDCQNHNSPLFKKSEGSAYLLLCMDLKNLLYCMTAALMIPFYNIEFVIHKVEVQGETKKQQEETSKIESEEQIEEEEE